MKIPKKKTTKNLIIDPKEYYDSLIFDVESSKLSFANDFLDLILDMAIDIQQKQQLQQEVKAS